MSCDVSFLTKYHPHYSCGIFAILSSSSVLFCAHRIFRADFSFLFLASQSRYECNGCERRIVLSWTTSTIKLFYISLFDEEKNCVFFLATLAWPRSHPTQYPQPCKGPWHSRCISTNIPIFRLYSPIHTNTGYGMSCDERISAHNGTAIGLRLKPKKHTLCRWFIRLTAFQTLAFSALCEIKINLRSMAEGGGEGREHVWRVCGEIMRARLLFEKNRIYFRMLVPGVGQIDFTRLLFKRKVSFAWTSNTLPVQSYIHGRFMHPTTKVGLPNLSVIQNSITTIPAALPQRTRKPHSKTKFSAIIK